MNLRETDFRVSSVVEYIILKDAEHSPIYYVKYMYMFCIAFKNAL